MWHTLAGEARLSQTSEASKSTLAGECDTYFKPKHAWLCKEGEMTAATRGGHTQAVSTLTANCQHECLQCTTQQQIWFRKVLRISRCAPSDVYACTRMQRSRQSYKPAHINVDSVDSHTSAGVLSAQILPASFASSLCEQDQLDNWAGCGKTLTQV